jgi:hypothetical protein
MTYGGGMKATAVSADREAELRRGHLLRLRWELERLEVQTRVRRSRHGRLKLRLRVGRWSETVMCAGAEDAYAFVTVHGRLLGPASDARHIARVLVWMAAGRRR